MYGCKNVQAAIQWHRCKLRFLFSFHVELNKSLVSFLLSLPPCLCLLARKRKENVTKNTFANTLRTSALPCIHRTCNTFSCIEHKCDVFPWQFLFIETFRSSPHETELNQPHRYSNSNNFGNEMQICSYSIEDEMKYISVLRYEWRIVPIDTIVHLTIVAQLTRNAEKHSSTKMKRRKKTFTLQHLNNRAMELCSIFHSSYCK